MDPAWEDTNGVPISAILFGGRRSATVPLVYEAFDWEHGTFLGCSVSSEMTAAAEGEIGKLRHDPFAMLPFCGYNMADYFGHWLKIGKQTAAEKLPRIFAVNWFRKDDEGNFLWPGFGENIRVLKWIFERTQGVNHAEKTSIGWIPKKGALDISGIDLTQRQMDSLFAIDTNAWQKETEEMGNYLAQFGSKLPLGIKRQLEQQSDRLKK
jgi:phosphoenolpyruvate carboxykinase (GTP)